MPAAWAPCSDRARRLALLVAMLGARAPASLTPATVWLCSMPQHFWRARCASRWADQPASRLPDVLPLLVPFRAADQALARRLAWRGRARARCYRGSPFGVPDRHLETQLRTGAESYTAPEWRQSELAAALRRGAEADTVYGNAPDAVYFLAGRPAQFSPRRTYYASDRPVTEDLPRFASAVLRAPVRLAWFHELRRDFLYSPAELGERFEVTPEGRFADGEIDRVGGQKRK